MEINNPNDNNDDQENPLFQEYHHLRTFHQEFNHSPDLFDPGADEHVTSLFTKENKGYYDPRGVLPDSEKIWVKNYRLWMLKILFLESVVDFGLQRYRSAYLAVIYFERFLILQWSRLKGMDSRIKMIGATCFLVAAKVEEGRYPPNLPLIYYHTFALFKKMEHIVAEALWPRLVLITPLNLTNFFMRKFEAFPAGNGGNVASRIAAFVFTAMKVNGTLEYRPSVVAAAATLAAVDRNLTIADIEERISRSRVSDFGFTATVDDVHRCYSLINELDPYQELVFHTP